MALIEYKNVSVFHQDDDAVLNGIDFNVDEGEFIYIIGKVGSGKSSLLRTFYAELDIEEAEKAEVLGRDMMTIRRKEVPALRRELGIIFQNFQLLTDRSVSKNLEFVLKATARSLLNNPKVILADEPTGNLDPETADNIVALLKDITATGTAVVMTTHNLPMLDKYPGIVYQCGEGKLEDITAQYRQFQQE